MVQALEEISTFKGAHIVTSPIARYEPFRTQWAQEPGWVRDLAAGDGLLSGARQAIPTRRTRRVGHQPRVDASDVEAMVALGEHPDRLAGNELGQAYGTYGVGAREFRAGRVEKRRKAHDRFLLQPGIGRFSAGPPRAPESTSGYRIETQHTYNCT